MAPQTKKRKVEAVKTNLHQIGDDCMVNIFSYLSNFEPFELMTTCKQFRSGVEQLHTLTLGSLVLSSPGEEEEFEESEFESEELDEDIRNKFNGWLNSNRNCEQFRIIKIINGINAKEAKTLMENCPKVIELSFPVSGKLTIPKFSELKKLVIEGRQASFEFSCEIPTLKSLTLHSPIKSCQEIVNNFPNLEELQITFSGSDLSPLKSLTNLKSLYIATVSSTKKSLKADQIYETMSIPTLETFKLNMHGPTSLCIPFIKRKVSCPQLKTLEICNNEYFMDVEEEVPEEEDFDRLICEFVKSDFPKLESIRLKFSSTMQSLDALLKNESISNIKSLVLIDISHECFKQVCSNPSWKGLTELECKIDMGIDEESSVFKLLAESQFENLKSFKINYQEFNHSEIGFKEFCASDKFTKLEHLHLGFQIESKDNLLLPKSTHFPNLKSLYIMYLQGKVKSFLTTLGKNESFGRLEEFTIGMYVEATELQKLKKSLKRLTRVKSEENEDDDE
ncbi:predicted protein [Naegleria gruberi]|uniref:Predicted protein n=1 Tax=Naegleria gruberi TaxID=5762 RepID=D2VL22_NAEGR|nr:uncharacterized protein NAEGRDRAFT_50445 [Naegleria gruberi]EFC42547.1 predicted protein [Naegleria gruberi]|eukprot:XP_002675291.1 predicted protein [Naegleria gruberi strain NEG-M]